MKLTDLPDEDGELHTFLEFSYDEEHAMARWVMAMLAMPWMDTYPLLQQLLNTIIHRKSRGKDITAEQFIELGDRCERCAEHGAALPSFPKIKEGGSRIVAPADIHGVNAIVWLEKTKSGIWYEEWKHNDEIKTKVGMWVFPGREPGDEYREHQYQLEERFWLEVDRRQAEYECSRRDAIVAVSDHMQRADDEYRLLDPSIDYT